MIGMMISALYNLVDAYFVGRLGTAQVGAVSVVYPLSLVVLGLGLLFGSGASSYLARLLGKGKKEEADKGASTALAASVLTGVVIIVFMLIFINPILKCLIFDFESATFILLCLNDFKVEIDLTIVVKFIIDSEMSIQYMEKIEHKRRDAAIWQSVGSIRKEWKKI